ncbi:NAD+ synthase [Roseomonas sp. OT10]|uniref:nitrilase-related carbon-nitrogen hydrolase n=1 Tax=Roseomonas cutis TaxID=2897332 RepID=UPI001E570063|nr:nitrilase-related carbon-nitrogen hydrolase [Roseomonas sp. OT10]UFN50464.1 NAD+ synthase [Roseomonas sp. OT10]
MAPPDTLRIALAQCNPHPGAMERNADRLLALRAEAAAQGADLLLTPELGIAGHAPQDLPRLPDVQAACDAALARLAAATADGGPGMVVGGPWAEGGRRFDAVTLLDGGRVVARRARHAPSGEDGFDPGPAPGPVAFRGIRLGLLPGEDAWTPEVAETLAESGAELLLSTHASPFVLGRSDRRVERAVPRVVETGLPFVFLNRIGGLGEGVADGASFVLNADCSLAATLPAFAEALAVTDWSRDGQGGWRCAARPLLPWLGEEEATWRALVLGLRDHVERNGCPGVVLDLAGGPGAALAAACAVDALGAGRVRGVLLPGPDTTAERLEEAEACAGRLGLRCATVPLAPALDAFAALLAPALAPLPPGDSREGAAREAIPPRARAAALLALSDATGDLPLATVDRSGLAVGEAAPGDGFALLKDLYRTDLLRLARWRNANRPAGLLGPEGPVVPERAIAAPPVRDGLPPQPALDAILHGLVEREAGVEALVAEGLDREAVRRVWRLLAEGAYKRRQSPPGLTLFARPNGRDRRAPITHGYTAAAATGGAPPPVPPEARGDRRQPEPVA